MAERKRLWAEEALPGRAEGGPVDEDQAVVVGERGAEIFVPTKKGVVVPDLSTLSPVKETKEDEVALAGKG